MKQHASLTNLKQGKHVVTTYETMGPEELRYCNWIRSNTGYLHSPDLETLQCIDSKKKKSRSQEARGYEYIFY